MDGIAIVEKAASKAVSWVWHKINPFNNFSGVSVQRKTSEGNDVTQKTLGKNIDLGPAAIPTFSNKAQELLGYNREAQDWRAGAWKWVKDNFHSLLQIAGFANKAEAAITNAKNNIEDARPQTIGADVAKAALIASVTENAKLKEEPAEAKTNTFRKSDLKRLFVMCDINRVLTPAAGRA